VASRGKPIRFGVGSEEELRSSLWRVWGDKQGAYLSTRVMTSLFKVSLHQSGVWRMAYTRESGILAEASTDRVERRWQRPAEFTPGWTQGPSIIVPSTPLQRGFPANLEAKGTKWYQPPAGGRKLVFTVLLSARGVPPEDWRRVTRQGDEEVGRVSLPYGETVWLAARYAAIERDEETEANRLLRDIRIHVAHSDTIDGASVQVVNDPPGGQPNILDVALGYENIERRPTS
jgi:hypothetical protein